MKVMSDALMDLAGDRMRKIMIRLTSNRVKGVLTGLFITGLIQSSSATTLMVVSFVNAQLLSLTEAISVIMGANIGTTFTAWLIAILGFKVKMSAIALPLIILGFFFYLKKDRQLYSLGKFIIGFSLLFIGLEFMKDAISGLENNPALFGFFQRTTDRGFVGIILFIGIGTLLTLLLQSSSATMAITLVAASQGVVTFQAAAAIVLGENIGTTITANMAAFISGTEARRAALAHLFFNLIGVIWVLIIFEPFLRMIDQISMSWMGVSPMINAADIPIGLSLFHSIFNLLNTAFLIWFVFLIARLVTFIVREKVVPEPVLFKPKYLKKRALKYPETALSALLLETKRLYEGVIIEGVAHGLGIHRKDIKSNLSSEDVIKFKKDKTIYHEDYIKTRIRPIFGSMLSFASKIQEKFQLSPEDNKKLSRLIRTNRDAQEILVYSKTLKKEIARYSDEKNKYLEEEYLRVQCAIIDLLRIFLTTFDEMTPGEKELKLKELKQFAKKGDADLLEDIDSLIRKKRIKPQHGISLITSSNAVLNIYKLLIKATRYLMSSATKDIELEPEEINEEILLEE
jgi:phosphate:Na+ symporter